MTVSASSQMTRLNENWPKFARQVLQVLDTKLDNTGDTPASGTYDFTACTIKLPAATTTKFGGGAGTFGEEGNVNRQIPGVTGGINPGATGADNVVAVYSIPASSFDQSGRGITMMAAGNFAATANTKRCKLILNPATAVVGSTVGAGGITIADTGAVAQNGGAWVLMGSLFKRGAGASNTQVAIPGGVILSGSHVGATAACQEVTATESGAILVAVTGNATTVATDIILAFLEVNAMN